MRISAVSSTLTNQVGSVTSQTPEQAKNMIHTPEKMQLHDTKQASSPH